MTPINLTRTIFSRRTNWTHLLLTRREANGPSNGAIIARSHLNTFYCNGTYIFLKKQLLLTELHSYCGYDHHQRRSATRRIPYGFTGCLAHVEIITEQSTGQIRRVHGMLEHHTECHGAPLLRVPELPLHPSVTELALEQLHNGATLVEHHSYWVYESLPFHLIV